MTSRVAAALTAAGLSRLIGGCDVHMGSQRTVGDCQVADIYRYGHDGRKRRIAQKWTLATGEERYMLDEPFMGGNAQA